MSLRILVADDSYLVRLGVRRIFQASSPVICTEAQSLEELLAQVFENPIDVILTNFRLAGKPVLKSLHELQSASKAGILFYSGSENPIDQARACDAKTGGFVSWSASSKQLLHSVQAVAEGKSLWTGGERRRLNKHLKEEAYWEIDYAPLTPREHQVVRRVAEGDTNHQIAAQFGISAETVKEHIQNSMRKSGLVDRTQLAVWAVRNGWA